MLQSLVSLSTTKTEYLAVTEFIKQGGVCLHCDSQSAMHHVYDVKENHIDVSHHKVRESIATKEVIQENVHNLDDATNMLIRSIPSNRFMHCLN